MIEKKTRIQEFQALRALAIVLLMVVHSEVLGSYVLEYRLGGPLASFIATFLLGSFFFLAGYFEEVTLQKNSGNGWSIIRSKFIRIFPPYWLALFMYVFVLQFSLKRFDLSVYILNLQFIFSPAFVKQLLTLWYISIVVAYYVLFGVVIYYTKSNVRLLIWSVCLFAVTYILHILTNLFDPRFFQYFFIFLAGVYVSRFEQFRERAFAVPFLYKVGFAISGVFFFSLANNAEYEIVNGLRLLTADFFILSWVWMWLAIFRTKLGSWRIWSFISTASFFAYLYHRPFWEILSQVFGQNIWRPWGGREVFNLIPGSILVFIVCYFLQRAYDFILDAFRQRLSLR